MCNNLQIFEKFVNEQEDRTCASVGNAPRVEARHGAGVHLGLEIHLGLRIHMGLGIDKMLRIDMVLYRHGAGDSHGNGAGYMDGVEYIAWKGLVAGTGIGLGLDLAWGSVGNRIGNRRICNGRLFFFFINFWINWHFCCCLEYPLLLVLVKIKT